MRNIILVLSILLNAVLLSFLSTGGNDGNLEMARMKNDRGQRFHIAVITPTTHPSLENIERGFVDTMLEDDPQGYTFKTFNANGNKALLRSMVEEAANGGFDLIFTIGAKATQMTKEVFIKRNLKTPIVFGSVSKPLDLNIVASLDSSGNNLTGVYELMPYEEQIHTFCYLHPGMKRILLPYDPSTTSGLEKDKFEVENILKKRDIEIVPVEIFNTNEITGKVSPYIREIDAILVLKDNTVVPGLDALVKLAALHHVPLFTSDLDSVDRGAALGYGVHESFYGKEASKKALAILKDKIEPKEIPITPVEDFRIKINENSLSLQGLTIDPMVLFLIKGGEG